MPLHFFATADRPEAASFSGPTYNGIPPETQSVIQEKPRLADLAGGDFHLTANSPASGKGRAVPQGVMADFDRRAYNDPPSRGAFAAPN